MPGPSCNIDKTDRINRVVIGLILFLGALLGAGKWLLLLMGAILVAEGLMGWCGIPLMVAKLKAMRK